MIVMTIRIQTSPANRKELMQTFRSLCDPIKKEPGCESFRIYREVENEEAVIVIGEWDCPSHWDEHRRSDEFAIMMGAMSLLRQPEAVELKVLDQLEGSHSMKEIRALNLQETGDRS